MQLPILYSFRRCPYAMRSRMAMNYSKISYEHREILLRKRPQALYDISAKGTVPVLQLPDGRVIDESIDIMRWALKKSDPQSWYKDKISEQDNILKEMILCLNTGLIDINTMFGTQKNLLKNTKPIRAILFKV